MPGPSPLSNQLALHLRKARHDVEVEWTHRGLGVGTVDHAAESHVARLEPNHQVHESGSA
jgi:hypothetical protein